MITREQQRARYAYKCAQNIQQRDGYKTLIGSLGTTIQRDGLVAALAFLLRYHDQGIANAMLQHLEECPTLTLQRPPNIQQQQWNQMNWCDKIRNIETQEYMFATRELLQLAQWLKRAVDTEGGGA